jgi:hypothetical protein
MSGNRFWPKAGFRMPSRSLNSLYRLPAQTLVIPLSEIHPRVRLKTIGSI